MKLFLLNRLRNFTRKLGNKLGLAFSLIVCVLILVLATVSYYRTTWIIKDNYISNTAKELEHMNESLDNYVAQIDALSLSFRRDDNFMEALMNDEEDFSSRLYIENQLRNLFYPSSRDIAAVSLFIPRTGAQYTISRLTDSPKLEVDHPRHMTSNRWYKEASSRASAFRSIEPPVPSSRAADMDNEFFTFHRALINIPSQRPLGMVSITINSAYRDKMISDILEQDAEVIAIFDRNNTSFFNSSGKTLSHEADLLRSIDWTKPEGYLNWSSGKQDFLVTYDVSPGDGWKLIKLISTSALNERAANTRNLEFLIGLAFLLIGTLLVTFATKTITRPLKRLSKQMEKVGGANFDVMIDINGNDEIAYLSKKFNAMVAKINELINEEYKAKLGEKTARMKALEAQINPHFLYNALQTISTEALVHKVDHIDRMVQALAYILRYSIRTGDHVNLSREMKNVESYVMLQQARYGERLSVQIGLEESIGDIHVPKMAVQLLVENSIKHVLEQTLSPVMIRIRGYFGESRAIIEVSDNGPGIPQDRLKELQELLQKENWLSGQQESIGLRNLSERLKLLIHTGARLDIRNHPEGGVSVQIIIPVED
ncbi:cache domain-containing sensor histidine kinase [Paenibacillus rhizophilus]|uniref:HAMP domain-containing protein n=1 Tax=Paenibacillus rhizophilus TaxID=1850366 RepID=A0A3N9PBA0_9BACL|nr:sensor histidine kinase [Paenibacillus rhizophilus]RQW12274.1 HAMP domain-containing protein [Paenibacillus rhizophilus]